ncbi:MAG: PAS domain S-box protein [Gammaproteobacteria bacterium]|nr:PAS domain S-box protein [Gammaproteobacteria bacterium]
MVDYAQLSKAQLIRKLRESQAQLERQQKKSSAHLEHDLQVHHIELEMQNRELREVEHQLELARDRYADLYDFAPVGYLTLDARGRILELNLTAAAMLGQERARLQGKFLTTWLRGEDKLALLQHLTAALHIQGASSVSLGVQVFTPARPTIDAHVESVAVAMSPVHGWVCRTILLDVSRQREAERALVRERDFAEGLVTTAPAIVLVLDTEGRILRFNPYMEKISGYQLCDVQGQDWFTIFIPPSERQRVRELYGVALQGVHTLGNVNAILTRDGHERLIEWYDSVLHDAQGRRAGLLAIGLDVTDKQQLRLEAETHRENFAHLTRVVMINELASGLAHELSQPLTAITSYTQETLRLLPEGSMVTAAHRHGLEQALNQSKRAADIIQHLRNFVGKHVAAMAPSDINVLVHHALELMEYIIKKCAVNIRLELADALPPVMVDGLQIEQVIMNLVQNALDAMPDVAQARREVTLKTALTADGQLAVSVSDLGVGLAPAHRGRLFQPFFTTKHKGLGMGLVICRAIVDAHGGKLVIVDNQPKGSTFRFTLPVGVAEHA